MQFKLRLLSPLAAATLILVACGGGSSSAPSSTGANGIAVDGYLVGASAYCNVDGTGVVPSAANFSADAVTDLNGNYTFSKGCSSGVVIVGGRSKDTGLVFRGTLSAPAGATVVSPISTLVAALMKTGKTAAEAQYLINKSLQLSSDTDLLNTDPAKLNGAGTGYANLALLKSNLTVQSLIQTTTDNIAALAKTPPIADTKPIYSTTAAALASTLAGDLRPLNTEIVAAFIAMAATSTTASTSGSEVQTALAGNGATNFAQITAVAVNNLSQSYSDPTKLTSASTVDQIASLTAAVQSDNRIATVIGKQTAALSSLTAKTIIDGVNAIAAPTATVQPVTSINTTTTTSTAATTSTTSTTTTTTLPNNFLYLANDSVGFDTGTSVTQYTLTQFQTGAGIPVQWPLANTAAIKFTLADGGAFSVPSGQTYSAALSIADTASSAQVSAYVNNISLSKNGSSIVVSVPSTATGSVYFRSAEGTEALCNWANCGAGTVNNTMSTASGAVSGIVLGQVVNNAVTHLSGSTAMSGKYVVTLVVSGLPMSYADRTTPLPVRTVSIPNGTASPTLVMGSGLQGYITVTNTSGATTATTTTTSTTTTTTLSPSNSYLTLTNDTLTYNNGIAATPYTMTQFQTSPGITVKWPMSDAATISFNLAETGTYVPVAGQTLTAAISLTDLAAGSSGKIKAYIDNVKVTRGPSGITVTVPSTATAVVYGVTRDGTQAALVPMSNLVAGVNNTLGTGANSVVLGSIINSAVSSAGSSFTGVNALTGTYAVSIVVTDLPVRQASGALFPTTTITVPTSLSGTNVRTITGAGLTGFITLAP
jgi:hypothetical protein